MTNAAAVAPTRRARTAAGTTPPQIALDLARVVAAVSWTRDLLDCCNDTTLPALVEAVNDCLTGHLSKPLEHVTLAALGGFVDAHLTSHVAESGRPAGALWSWLTQDTVRGGLRSAFDAVTAAGALDDVIADAVADGVDGELLTWNLINRESTKHEGLIHKECNRLARTLPDRSPDDLKGYGWHGLRMALRSFDPSLGWAFSTYACPKINGAIRDGARAESPIPKRLTTFVRKVTQAEEKLTQILGRTPSYREIASYLDENIEAMTLLPRLAPSASIEELSNPWGEKTREPDCLIDPLAPEETVVIALRDEALHAAVNNLPEEEAVAVRLLMLQELPVGEAAALVGVEPRQLRMRKLRGMRALAPVMRAWLDDNAMAV